MSQPVAAVPSKISSLFGESAFSLRILAQTLLTALPVILYLFLDTTLIRPFIALWLLVAGWVISSRYNSNRLLSAYTVFVIGYDSLLALQLSLPWWAITLISAFLFFSTLRLLPISLSLPKYLLAVAAVTFATLLWILASLPLGLYVAAIFSALVGLLIIESPRYPYFSNWKVTRYYAILILLLSGVLAFTLYYIEP